MFHFLKQLAQSPDGKLWALDTGPNDGQVVASAWDDLADAPPTDQYFPRFKLLERLEPGKKKGSGTPIVGTIQYAPNTTVKDMGEMDTIDTTRIPVFDRWEDNWKFTGGAIVMSDYEEAVTAARAGKFDLLAGKLDNLKSSFMNQHNSDAFGDGTGFGGTAPNGLRLLVPLDPTTGTVESINRATFPFWRSQQTSGAKTTTAYDNLRSTVGRIYNSCSNGQGSETPDFAITDQTTFQGYEGLLVANERYVRTGESDKGISGFKGTSLMVKDIPLDYDGACTSGYVYLLNTRNLFIRYMEWMKSSPAVEPSNQFIKVIKILSMWNLLTNQSRRLGAVTGVT